MKIAVSAIAPDLDALVDPRFGRAPYFIIVDPDSMQFETMENSSASAPGGTGISVAQAIVGKGVQVVLTGSCGPNAYEVLSAAGVQIITGVSGTVRDAVLSFKQGKPASTSAPDVPPGEEEGLRQLKGQAEALKQQLSEINRRIDEITSED